VLIILGGLAALGILIVVSPASGSVRESATRVGAPSGPQPTIPIEQIRSVHITKGAMLPHGKVDVPTFRAVAPGTSGEAVALDFTYRGSSSGSRALASGQLRRQIGLKLRAANGCNLVYVMWRLDPSPQLEVSVKINPGMRTHAECGARGYTKLGHVPVYAPIVGKRHMLRAEIVNNELLVWLDGRLAWRGTLPDQARHLTGPSGMRSDNIAYDIFAIGAPAGQTGAGDTDGED
jgi:hypothetical protein